MCFTVKPTIYSSGSSTVAIYTMQYCNRTVHLIDTPGFDDTLRSETEILQEIAYWLVESYEHEITLSGIIYLHRITDPRLQGAALRSLNVFKGLCGPDNYKGVVLVSTRWEALTPTHRALASRRHQELCQKDHFWGNMIRGGSLAVADSATRDDALGIIRHIIRKNRKLVLDFQRQILEDHKPIHETNAGRVLYEQQTTLEYDELEGQLDEIRSTMESEISRESKRGNRDLDFLRTELESSLKPVSSDLSKLKMDAHKLKSTWEDYLRKDYEMLTRQMTHGESPPRSYNNSVHEERKTSSIASPGIIQICQSTCDDRRFRDEVMVAQKYRLVNRPGHSRGLTALSFIGTGIAGAQLIAAMACVVM
jgi:hypothetical protein